MDLGIQDRVAIVTGAGRNIGREIALTLAREGAHVALCTRSNLDGLEEAAGEIEQIGRNALVARCDVTSREQVDRFVGEVRDHYGRIDILVNNAVHRVQKPLFEIGSDEWDLNLGVNLTGPLNTCRAALPAMQARQWGRVVNFSGFRAYIRGGGLAKTTTKLGIVGFTRAIASEFGSAGITANCVSPGTIEVVRDAGLEREADRKGHVDPSVPINRFGLQSEIAGAVSYLVSEQAAYVTGQVLGVNGGAHYHA